MKKLLGYAAIAAVAAFGIVFANSRSSDPALSTLQIQNVEALTDEEYTIGLPGTNWKVYRVQCQSTVGFDWFIVVTKTTTYWADVCGAGSGYCLYPAGC